MHRPVIINSLLCFVQNFRTHPNLQYLIAQYFSKMAIEEAIDLLKESFQQEETPSTTELLELFDLHRCKFADHQFAVTDLSSVPLTILSNDTEKSEILSEIRSLRSFLNDALDSSRSEESMMRNSSTPHNSSKLNTSVSSPEFLINQINDLSEENVKPLNLSPICTSPVEKQQCTKRKIGKSLDAAVKKLSEKRKAEVMEDPMAVTSPQQEVPRPQWVSPIDPQAYLNMLRMVQSSQNTSFLGTMIQRLNGVNPSTDMTCDEKEEGMEDDDSSPSPSEDLRDDFGLEMSVDNESDKPFVCEHANCHKRFANKFLLKKHQFIHTGLRPHTCPYCNKRFNRKDNLLRHKKTHIQNNGEAESRKELSETISSLFPSFPLVGLESIKMEPKDDPISTV